MKDKISDAWNFILKLNPAKLRNAFLLYFSYQISKFPGLTLHWGDPMNIAIEPTTACNLKCSECPSGLRSFSRPTGTLGVALYKSLIDQLGDKLISLILYFQGEPFIHRNFIQLVEYAHSKGIYTMSSTNGHFLSKKVSEETVKSGLDRLIISIDGSTQEIYQQYRKNGNLDKVICGATNIVEWKHKLGIAKPYLIFQFLVVRPNEHQIGDIKKLARQIGVNQVKFKSAQLMDYQNGNDLIPLNEKYSRYKRNGQGEYVIDNRLKNRCWKMWHSCVVTWDGQLLPCCFDKDANFPMGNAAEKKFHSIWKGEKFTSFRQKVNQSRKNILICSNCAEGCKVWI